MKVLKDSLSIKRESEMSIERSISIKMLAKWPKFAFQSYSIKLNWHSNTTSNVNKNFKMPILQAKIKLSDPNLSIVSLLHTWIKIWNPQLKTKDIRFEIQRTQYPHTLALSIALVTKCDNNHAANRNMTPTLKLLGLMQSSF